MNTGMLKHKQTDRSMSAREVQIVGYDGMIDLKVKRFQDRAS